MISRLRPLLEALDRRVRGMSGRERLLLYAAVLLTPFLLIFQFAVVPLEQQQEALNDRIEQTRTDTGALQEQTAALATREDPREALRAREEEAREEAAAIEQRLQSTARDLLGPERTAQLLRELLAGRGDLELQTLARRTPETLVRGEESGIRIRNHRIELEVTGAYLEILALVRHLEGLPLQWLWNDAELTAGDHSASRLQLTMDALEMHGLEDDE